MIQLSGLTKRHGEVLAVDDLTFTVRPGLVTGFLGPNGAGKTTTMRMILGLDLSTSGTATVNGRRHQDLPHPLREVGSLLEAQAVHPQRTARKHLLYLAQTNGLPRARVDEVLDLVGLTDAADRTAGGFSLGMSQRLGIAAALLGDPPVLLLDEPVNGLDPEGVLWMRTLIRGLAAEGRTVLVSSHLMSEMALTADRLVVIGKGRLIAESDIAEFTEDGAAVLVRTPAAPDRRARAGGPGRRADRDRHDGARHRAAGGSRGGAAVRAHPTADVTGGGVHGVDPGEHRVRSGGEPMMIDAGVIRAEWTKFSSIRATMVLSLATVVVAAVLGWLFGRAAAGQYSSATPQERLEFAPLDMGMRGLFIAQLLVAALGVLVASTEYGSGTMRASVAAVGRRDRLVAAKAGLTALTALPVSTAAVWLMFVASQTTLATGGAPYAMPGDPAALRTLLLGPLVFTLLALFGLALGFLLRGTAAAVNVSTAFLLLPMFSTVSPAPVRDFITTYWPNMAAFQTVSGTSDLPVWAGSCILVGFVAVMMIAAFVQFNNRDA
jgi:ABC-2 type transport system ATP-binding protein